MEKEVTDYFNENAETYDAWYEAHPREYEDQVEFISSILPHGKGLEIGVGTGRFASLLGIRTGIDPSERMVEIARRRGIEAVMARAEDMPFGDGEFDFSLNMVTICFLEDPLSSIREARRISRVVVTVILDRDSEYVRDMMTRKDGFYRYAKFYTGDELVDIYREAGFKETERVERELTTADGRKYRLVGIIGR